MFFKDAVGYIDDVGFVLGAAFRLPVCIINVMSLEYTAISAFRLALHLGPIKPVTLNDSLLVGLRLKIKGADNCCPRSLLEPYGLAPTV